jgi:hypothetical protein
MDSFSFEASKIRRELECLKPPPLLVLRLRRSSRFSLSLVVSRFDFRLGTRAAACFARASLISGLLGSSELVMMSLLLSMLIDQLCQEFPIVFVANPLLVSGQVNFVGICKGTARRAPTKNQAPIPTNFVLTAH